MKHEEYISLNRKRASDIAKGMLDGSVHYLEGAIELSSLRFEVGLPEDDEDFIAFAGIASEIDHLPIGPVRQRWSIEALDRCIPEIESAIEWAKYVSMSNCKSIADRFNA